MDWIWIFISFFGDLPFWVLFSITLICVFFYSKKIAKKIEWVYKYALPSVSFSALAAYTMKIIFKEPRICQGLYFCPSSYGFPSMHSAVAFAFSVAAVIYFRNEILKNSRLFSLIIISITFSFLIAYSRIAMGVHTFEEVIAGAMVGIAFSSAWCMFYEHYKKKVRNKQKRK